MGDYPEEVVAMRDRVVRTSALGQQVSVRFLSLQRQQRCENADILFALPAQSLVRVRPRALECFVLRRPLFGERRGRQNMLVTSLSNSSAVTRAVATTASATDRACSTVWSACLVDGGLSVYQGLIGLFPFCAQAFIGLFAPYADGARHSIPRYRNETRGWTMGRVQWREAKKGICSHYTH